MRKPGLQFGFALLLALWAGPSALARKPCAGFLKDEPVRIQQIQYQLVLQSESSDQLTVRYTHQMAALEFSSPQLSIPGLEKVNWNTGYTESPLPKHSEAIQTYFTEALEQKRQFDPSRMSWLHEVENEIPLYRQALYVVEYEKEMVGLIKLVNGNTVIQGFQNPEATVTTFQFADGQHELPLERSLKKRGMKTDLVDQYRTQYPKSLIFEAGRAFRASGPGKEEIGKLGQLIWELGLGMALVHPLYRNNEIFLFIHTDAQGARLYRTHYGAKPLQKIDENTGSVTALDPDVRIQPGSEEYVLVVNRKEYIEGFVKTVSRQTEWKTWINQNSTLQTWFEQVSNY